MIEKKNRVVELESDGPQQATLSTSIVPAIEKGNPIVRVIGDQRKFAALCSFIPRYYRSCDTGQAFQMAPI